MSGLDKKSWDEWKEVSDSICRLDWSLKLSVLFTWRHFESSQVDKSSMLLIIWLSFVGRIWWIGTNQPTKYGLLQRQCGFTPNEKSPNWKVVSIETAERAESEWNREALRGIFNHYGMKSRRVNLINEMDFSFRVRPSPLRVHSRFVRCFWDESLRSPWMIYSKLVSDWF